MQRAYFPTWRSTVVLVKDLLAKTRPIPSYILICIFQWVRENVGS